MVDLLFKPQIRRRGRFFCFCILLLAGAGILSVGLSAAADSVIIKIGTEAPLQLPDSFSANAEKFQGNEIEYHLNIKGRSGLVYGFFQIINPHTELLTTDALDSYLNNAERYKSAQITSFRSERKATGNTDGIVWTYKTRVYEENGKASDILARQAFTVKNNKIYTLSLFAHADVRTEAELDTDFYRALSTLSV